MQKGHYSVSPPFFLVYFSCCSKAMLTGESRFHISTPLGIEPGSLMAGSKRLDHWTGETVYECSERLQALHRAPPKQPTISVVKPDYDGLVTVWDKACRRRGHNDQSRLRHQCSETMLTGESLFHISTPLGVEPLREANGWTTGPVELCMNAVRDCRLSTMHPFLSAARPCRGK
jgi:hypothetical protein